MAQPRFLFDEDLQGVGSLIQQGRSHVGDIWVIGRQPCTVKKGTPDEIWLPVAAKRQLVVFRIDKDALIHGSASNRAWHDLGCRGFVLTIQQSKSSLWNQLRALVRNWEKIEGHRDVRSSDKSWIGRITANRVIPA